MNSSISNSIESAMLKLYEILAQRSDVELPPNFTKDPSEQTSIIIYERYLPDNNTLFLYAYDSTTFIIFKQYHIEVDQITPNLQQYYIILQNFLTELLASNAQLCIYFLNFGTYLVTDLEQKLEEAIKILNQNLATNKIILCMDQQEIPKLSEGYLNLNISSNQLALLKYEHDRIKELGKYRMFTLNKIFEIQQIHLKFLELQQINEQYIGMFNIFTLIKDITQIENLTNSTEYLAQFLFNLPKYTQQDTLSVIQKLKSYINKTQNKTKHKQKLKNQELQSLFESKLALFKDEKNWHFPKKGANSQKCKVCQKHNKDEQLRIRKSSYICHSCQKYYKLNITLCTINCFKLFHLNPGFYMGRIKKKSIKKVVKVEE